MKSNHFETQCVHEGQVADPIYKGAISPLYMATAYSYEDADRYPRYMNTPNQVGLAKKIAAQWSELGQATEIFNITDIEVNTLTQYEFLILGIPTWDFGGIQSDWEDLGDELSQLDLKGKIIDVVEQGYKLGDKTIRFPKVVIGH